MKVYLLWTHGEDGPEELRATLDRDKVLGLAKDYYTDDWIKKFAPNLMQRLDSILLSNPSNDIYNLVGGWGGLHLQIVELE